MRKGSADQLQAERDAAKSDAQVQRAEGVPPATGAAVAETDWDDESEQTHALEFKTLAPWYVPELREDEFHDARELSWEATLDELVETTDAPQMYESHSRPIVRRPATSQPPDGSQTPLRESIAASFDAAFPPGMWCAPEEATPSYVVAAPQESGRPETRRTRTLGAAVRPATPLPRAANDSSDAPPSATPSAAEPDAISDHSELRGPSWLWLFAAAMTVLVIGLTLRLWLLTMSEVSSDEPTVQALGGGFLDSRREQTGFVIDTRPSGAEVHVDGSSTGLITPARIQHLTAGVHAIQLKLPGYSDTGLRAVLEDGVTADLPDVVLQPLAASSAPAQPALAEPAPVEPAAVEPAPVEPAPAPPALAEPASVEPAPAQAALAAPAAAQDAPARDAPADRTKARAGGDALSGVGVLQITSRPWARIFVDGRFVGETPQRGLRLQAGQHAIRLVNEELSMSRSFKLTVRKGQTIAKFVDLQ